MNTFVCCMKYLIGSAESGVQHIIGLNQTEISQMSIIFPIYER